MIYSAHSASLILSSTNRYFSRNTLTWGILLLRQRLLYFLFILAHTTSEIFQHDVEFRSNSDNCRWYHPHCLFIGLKTWVMPVQVTQRSPTHAQRLALMFQYNFLQVTFEHLLYPATSRNKRRTLIGRSRHDHLTFCPGWGLQRSLRKRLIIRNNRRIFSIAVLVHPWDIVNYFIDSTYWI